MVRVRVHFKGSSNRIFAITGFQISNVGFIREFGVFRSRLLHIFFSGTSVRLINRHIPLNRHCEVECYISYAYISLENSSYS